MKFLLISIILIFGTIPLFSAYALQDDGKLAEAALENIDAIQALAIANQWKWSKKEIKSYINSRKIVLKFSDGKIKKIPLPDDKMLVAVAPYIKRTHK